MLPSSDLARRSDLGTPRKRVTTGGGSHSGSSTSGSDVFRTGGRSVRRSSASGAAQKRKMIIIGAVGSAVLLAIVIGVVSWAVPNARNKSAAPTAAAVSSSNTTTKASTTTSSSSSTKSKPSKILDAAYCSSLPTSTQTYCMAYYKSAGNGRFAAASQWQKMSAITYECAGVDSDCLNADLKANKFGSTCQPLADGSQCMGGATCSKGLCGGQDAWKAEQAAAAAAKAEQLTEDTSSKTGAKVTAAKAAPAPAKPAPVKVVPAWANFSAAIMTDSTIIRVPETFLATSHEWDRITDYSANLEAFSNIFREFGPSPILRMGGASQDAMTEPPKKEIWQAMATMHKEFNARFLIGLPLWRPDSVDMARKMMKLAEQYLPADAIIGYELGNEPEFWPTSVGGYEPSAPTTFVPGFEAYSAYFARVATALNPCPATGAVPKLSGPGWGNVNTIDASWLAMQAKAPGVRCYMRELSVHYYPYVNNATIDAKGLLAQDLQDFGVSKFNWLNGVGKAVNLNMRISETNSLYGGGRPGLSDTMAGTMWCADALFAFASAGAVGFHFHWGFGGRPSAGGQPNTGVQTNFFSNTGKPYPSVHAPWYGYLLFRAATAGADGGFSDTTLVNVNTQAGSCGANIKVWGLLSDGGSLRVAILNKDIGTSCNVVVTLDNLYCSKLGTISRLMPGAAGMNSKDGITWRNQTYDGVANGKLLGNPATPTVQSVDAGGGKCTMTVPMPAASGAVLEVSQNGVAPTK